MRVELTSAQPTPEQIIAYADAYNSAMWKAAFAYADALIIRYVDAVAAAQRSTVHWSPPAPAAPQRATQPVWRPSGGSGTPANGFLACVRNRESRGNYYAVNPSSGAAGAYQFMPGTWAAMHTGYSSPLAAPPSVQDAAAARLYAMSGAAPWGGSC